MDIERFIKDNKLQKEPHEINDFIWYENESLSTRNKLEISFKYFELKPNYWTTANWKMNYNNFNKEEKIFLWDKYRYYLLKGTKEEKEKIEYSLWVDFFEDISTCKEAWNNILTANYNSEIIKRILPISGPVDYKLKSELYKTIIPEKKYHNLILKSLHGSFFDVYGDIEVMKARKLLLKLDVDYDSDLYKETKKMLFKYKNKTDYIKKQNKK